MQGSPLQQQGANRRDFGGHQFGGQGMLFEYLRFAPALRAVKLGHHRLAVLQMHLVNPVLVGTQRQQPSITIQTHTGQRVHHQVWCQGLEGMQCDGRRFGRHEGIVGLVLL